MNTAPKVRRRAIRHRTRAGFVALVLLALATSCYSPQGSFESALAVTGGTGSVRVIGWAADRDSVDPVQIQVTIDGAAAGSFTANGARPDVLAANPELPSANVGFDRTIATTAGTHTVCVTALDRVGGDANTSLGCKTTATTGTARGNPSSYKFLTYGGQNMRWAPCGTVTYLANVSGATYPTALADIQTAMAEVGRRTGLRLVYGGTSTAVPTTSWVQSHTGQILVGYAAASTTDLLSSSSSSTLAVTTFRLSLPARITASVIAIEPNRTASLPTGFRASSIGTVLLHEIGHAVGLDHVNDPQQLLNSYLTTYGDYGAGDITGLSQVAPQSGCPAVAPQSIGEDAYVTVVN